MLRVLLLQSLSLLFIVVLLAFNRDLRDSNFLNSAVTRCAYVAKTGTGCCDGCSIALRADDVHEVA